MQILLFFLLVYPSLAKGNGADAIPLPIPVGQSVVLKIPKLLQAAVANGKIVKVRARPPSELLITAMKPGVTSVRAWAEGGTELHYEVNVLPPDVSATLDPLLGQSVVRITLEFIELDGSLTRNIGVHWPDSISLLGTGTWHSDPSMTGVNLTGSFATAKMWVDHLVSDGWARLLANPEIYVRMGEEATFHSGGELPVTSASESYGKTFRHVEWKPFGLTVKVRPKSADLAHIASDVKVEVSEVNRSQVVDGVPSLTRRKVETKMFSKDNQTVLLSGLRREIASQEKSAFPILGNVPIVGFFFTDSRGGSEETEILISITFSSAPQNTHREKTDAMVTRARGYTVVTP